MGGKKTFRDSYLFTYGKTRIKSFSPSVSNAFADSNNDKIILRRFRNTSVLLSTIHRSTAWLTFEPAIKPAVLKVCTILVLLFLVCAHKALHTFFVMMRAERDDR